MYISRIVGRIYPGDQYRMHQQVWRLFPGDAEKRDFMYRQDLVPGRGLLLMVVSARRPSVAHMPGWECQTKTYQPVVRSGMLLQFSLRANPVVTKRRPDGSRQRHDVIMNAKKRDAFPVCIQETGCAWLESRSERFGFNIMDMRADAYRQHRTNKSGCRIAFSTLDYEGLLKTIDPERLIAALYDGIGPSKSFGCGLLLVRRV